MIPGDSEVERNFRYGFGRGERMGRRLRLVRHDEIPEQETKIIEGVQNEFGPIFNFSSIHEYGTLS